MRREGKGGHEEGTGRVKSGRKVTAGGGMGGGGGIINGKERQQSDMYGRAN